MSHFAQVENGVVVQVIVAEQDVINSGVFGTGWIQTSYNTIGGQHPEGRPLRKNYAGIGYTYDAQRDAFIPPKLHASWSLNEDTCLWEAPVPYPTDGAFYVWDEAVLNWVLPENVTPPAQQPIIIETAGSYLETPAETITVDLGSNGADSIPGGV
jgi:hypothetical protein